MKILYFIVTFFESGLAVFGIRSPFETQPYRVVSHLSDGVEIRAYRPLVSAETQAGQHDRQAFQRLFDYISGANVLDQTISMTTPVEMRGMMTKQAAGSANDAAARMRFFLPKSMAADPPTPKDPRVHIVTLPARHVAVLRFAGRLDNTNVLRHEATLRTVVAKTNRKTESEAYVMGYDPPFTIPFLRRNEVAIAVEE